MNKSYKLFLQTIKLNILKPTFILIYITIGIRIFAMFPNLVENIYSRFLFKYITYPFQIISSKIKYSIAEITVILCIIFTITIFMIAVIKIKKSLKNKTAASLIKKYLLRTANALLVVYILFMIMWGLNYYRLPISSYMKNKTITEENLIDAAIILIKECNNLRNGMKDFPKQYNIKEFIEETKDLDRNYEKYIFLNNYAYSSPKPIILSEIFSILNITGIYFPFTSEANVNYKVPAQSILFTAAHEIAHQKGIAYEDEANFIAFSENYKNNNINIAYSVSLETLIYLVSAIERSKYKEISKLIDEKVLGDIKNIFLFWNKYDTVIAKTSNAVNDIYLKANSQKDGVRSYSRVVNLAVNYILGET